MLKQKVLLIGTGLIGGSLALAIRKSLDVLITGYDISKEQLNKAKQLAVIDEIADDLQEEAEAADLIVFASPVEETVKMMKQMAAFRFKENCIITDCGSTKRRHGITNDMGWENHHIGGHPSIGR